MMRNYVAELRGYGFSLKALSKETGLSTSRLSRLSKEKSFLRSKTKVYEKVRNASRRLASSELRKLKTSSGEKLDTRQVSLGRRHFFVKDKLKVFETKVEKPRILKPESKVKFPGETAIRYQLEIFARFRHTKKRHLVKIEFGHSLLHDVIDYDQMEVEAIGNVRKRKLDSTHWDLEEIIHAEIITRLYEKPVKTKNDLGVTL